jgi:PAS domain S-box-containing protein
MRKSNGTAQLQVEPPGQDGFARDTLFQRLLDKLPAGAYMCDPDGLITYYNEHAVQLWGRAPKLNDPADRFCGSFKLYSPDGKPIKHDRCWMALALRDQKEYNGQEILIERPGGERLTVLTHANPIRDDEGRLIGAVNVLVDITGQKRVEKALSEADQAKGDFLATMSHEIRTPINAVLGYLDLLDLELAGPLTPGQRRHLDRVQAASRHLLSLVNQVLDLSRIESDQMVIHRDTLDARQTADAAVSVVQPLAAARGIVIRTGIASDGAAPAFLGDEDRVRQMLINLLSNAIKFSEPGGSVEVTCERDERPDIAPMLRDAPSGCVLFRVRDAGRGIPPDELARIFEPFVQLESSRTRTRGGTGLGLTISRRLARAMGGDLTVESVLGEGSTFTVWLPAAEPDQTAELRASASPDPAACSDRFSAAGHAILASLGDIVEDYVGRIRAEEVGPGASALPGSQLASHAASIVTDIAVSLLSVGHATNRASLLHSGSEVLRVCAIEHGRQRAQLGWSEAGVAREYDILAEEILHRIRGRNRTRNDQALKQVTGAVRRRIDQARASSLCALHTPL